MSAMKISHQEPPPVIETVDEDDDGFNLESPPAAEPAPQVSSYVAIIRIVAVLGMGLSVSFGLFMMLAGLRGIIIGVPITLLAIPSYFGMRLAEHLALRAEGKDAQGKPLVSGDGTQDTPH